MPLSPLTVLALAELNTVDMCMHHHFAAAAHSIVTASASVRHSAVELPTTKLNSVGPIASLAILCARS